MSANGDALSMAAAGLPVFPCGEDKTPLTQHGFKDATTDAFVIDIWGEPPLWGVPTGEASGICAIDIDPAEGETVNEAIRRAMPEEARAVLREHQQEHGQFAVAKTRRGGAHFFALHNGEACVGTAAAVFGIAGVDGRCNGGYVIAWDADTLIEAAITELAWPTEYGRLREASKKPKPAPPPVYPQEQPQQGEDKGARTLADTAIGELIRASEGTRNDTLNRTAFTLFGLVRAGRMDDSEAERMLIQAGAAVGLPSRETASTIASARGAAQAGAGIQSRPPPQPKAAVATPSKKYPTAYKPTWMRACPQPVGKGCGAPSGSHCADCCAGEECEVCGD